ncbi:MAG: RagB/SusD family nutrient uptake outer membrane protein [Bacteroidales bacterium]|nr:RagB/SusD family nutrient uptake outer membrane protein [Bacteroidales bacterium]
MKRINSLVMIVAAVALSSCSFLDLSPKDLVVKENFYKTPDEIEEAVAGIYSTLASTSMFGGDMLTRMGLTAEIGFESYTTDEGTVGYNDVTPQDTRILNYWRQCYNGISNANSLLENISGASIDSLTRVRATSEALFLRGYYHYLLTLRFGDVPLMLSTVPSCSSEDMQTPQTSQAAVYAQALDDMITASKGLMTAQERGDLGGGRLTQSAAWGIISRVCLSMAGYPLYDEAKYTMAKEYAAKVIDLGFHRLNPDFQQVFVNYMQDLYDIQESIWEMESYGNGVGTYAGAACRVGRDNGIRFTNTGGNGDEIGYSIGALHGTPYLYYLYEDGDLRRDWTIATYTYDNATAQRIDPGQNYWTRCCGKFRREYETLLPKNTSYTPTNFPLLRYSDVLLMYAEAVAAEKTDENPDEVSRAYECLNQVRRRAYGKDALTPDSAVDIPSEGRAVLLDAVKDERAWELAFELHRKTVLVRWGN